MPTPKTAYDVLYDWLDEQIEAQIIDDTYADADDMTQDLLRHFENHGFILVHKGNHQNEFPLHDPYIQN